MSVSDLLSNTVAVASLVIPVGTSLGYMLVKSVVTPVSTKLDVHIAEDAQVQAATTDSLHRLEAGVARVEAILMQLPIRGNRQ